MDIPVKRVFAVSAVDFLFAIAYRCEKSCVFKPVKFYSDGVSRLPEFCFQSAQVGAGIAVQEEFPEQFYTGLGSN